MCKQLTVIDPTEHKSDNEDDNYHDSYKTSISLLLFL